MITDHQAYIATDFRYYEQVGLESADFELVKVTARFADALPELLAKTGVRRLAFEAVTRHLPMYRIGRRPRLASSQRRPRAS